MRCFGWFSKLDVTESADGTLGNGEHTPEDRKRLRKYEEEIARRGEPDDQSDEPLKKSRLDLANQWLCYDVRARIIFGVIFALFVGVGLPLIIYYADKPKEPDTIYGSCFMKQEYRVKCLPNKLTNPDEDDCLAAKCCWNGNQSLPFNCFHSLTPAYHYYVSNLRQSPSEATDLEKVEMDLNPNMGDRMRSLKAHIEWESLEHLHIQIFDTETAMTTKKRRKLRPRDGYSDTPEFSLNYATNGEYWFLKIERNDSKEAIFDTRLGPLIAGDDYISFTTQLSSPYFYGLTGGLTSGGDIFDNFNQYGPSDLPFYLGFEAASGHVHGVLLETMSPYLSQYLEAPGLMFHVEGPRAGLDLHFFVGPTVKDVYRQLQAHLNTKYEESTPSRMEMPPYWGLGLHLCRTANDYADALAQMNETTKRIPYDSDCIAEGFRNPFQIDNASYPPVETQVILDFLKEKNMMVLLSQKVILPGASTDLTNPLLRLIMQNETHPFVGLLDSEKHPAYYPDYLSPDIDHWLQDEFSRLTMSDLYGGLVLLENYPLTFNSTGVCETAEGNEPSRFETRLQKSFVNPTKTGYGLICPDALHRLEPPATHFEVHNLYGHESLLKIRRAFEEALESSTPTPIEQRRVYTSSSVWTTTGHYAGFNGPEVPFTWDGMIESLTFILRNFMFAPYTGTPICGSYLPSDDSWDPSDTNELCFRWFQLGLLLPFARNSYSADGPKGLLDLSAAYQDRVHKNIRERYKYNPYYYTLFYEYEAAVLDEAEPPIRPLLFDFPESASNLTFRIITQFMIGPALMAAPIVTRSSQREAYFPPGVWYNLAGKLQWSNEDEGGLLTVDGFVFELPIYLRGGYMIGALEEPILQGNAMQTRTGKYSIIGTYPTAAQPESGGHLFADDGVRVDSVALGHYDLLTFKMTNTTLTVEAACAPPESSSGIPRHLNQVKIFGFPSNTLESVDIEVSSDGGAGNKRMLNVIHDYDPENGVLYIKDLNLKWCEDFKQLNCTWKFVTEITTASATEEPVEATTILEA